MQYVNTTHTIVQLKIAIITSYHIKYLFMTHLLNYQCHISCHVRRMQYNVTMTIKFPLKFQRLHLLVAQSDPV